MRSPLRRSVSAIRTLSLGSIFRALFCIAVPCQPGRPRPALRLNPALTRLISVNCPFAGGYRDLELSRCEINRAFNPIPFAIRVGRGLWSFEFSYNLRARSLQDSV